MRARYTNLPHNRVGSYPLISPVNPVGILWDDEVFPVFLISNSTICDEIHTPFGLDQPNKDFVFFALGPVNTTGYFNLTAPKTLLGGPWQVLVDGKVMDPRIFENQTHATIYLNYDNAGQYSHHIQVRGTYVVPEYPSLSTLFCMMLLLLIPMILVAKNKRGGHPASATS